MPGIELKLQSLLEDRFTARGNYLLVGEPIEISVKHLPLRKMTSDFNESGPRLCPSCVSSHISVQVVLTSCQKDPAGANQPVAESHPWDLSAELVGESTDEPADAVVASSAIIKTTPVRHKQWERTGF